MVKIVRKEKVTDEEKLFNESFNSNEILHLIGCRLTALNVNGDIIYPGNDKVLTRGL